MSEFFSSLFWFVVTLSILVTFHEFGHFWVARKLGVKVLRFSVGFGNALWRRMGKDGTEYMIAAIPLGGYVKFLDEREAEVAPNEAHRAFNRAPLGHRVLIVLAGPVANFIFAIFAFWLVCVLGQADYPALLGEQKGLAAEAGLRKGDRILKIDGALAESYRQALFMTIYSGFDRDDLAIEVREADGDLVTKTLRLSSLPDGISEDELFSRIGLQFALPDVEAAIAQFSADSPAQNAGFRIGDQLLSINNIKTPTIDQFISVMQVEAKKSNVLSIRYMRDQKEADLTVAAKLDSSQANKPRYVIGFSPKQAVKSSVEKYSPLTAIPAAMSKSWQTVKQIGSTIKNIFVGRISPKLIAGPVGIAQIADDTASQGLVWFIAFLAAISINLGLVNLLPVPVLDGGHLMYYLIEWIKGKPLSERAMIASQYFGLALIGSLIVMVFYNDIVRTLAS